MGTTFKCIKITINGGSKLYISCEIVQPYRQFRQIKGSRGSKKVKVPYFLTSDSILLQICFFFQGNSAEIPIISRTHTETINSQTKCQKYVHIVGTRIYLV